MNNSQRDLKKCNTLFITKDKNRAGVISLRLDKEQFERVNRVVAWFRKSGIPMNRNKLFKLIMNAYLDSRKDVVRLELLSKRADLEVWQSKLRLLEIEEAKEKIMVEGCKGDVSED